MSVKTDQIKQMAQEKFSCINEHLDKAKNEIESSIGQCKSELDSIVEQVKAELACKKEQIDTRKSKFEATINKQKAALGSKVMELKEKVESKKDEKVKKRIIHKADKAEKYAEICMDYASVAIVEAELACLQACKARQQAEELAESAT